MTLDQFLSFLIMPIGGLLIGLFLLWWTGRESERFDREKRDQDQKARRSHS
jgi:hypothetical protein